MKKTHLKLLLLLIFTFSLNIHSQKVTPAENLLDINRQTSKPSENALEFNGQLHHHVNHGIFWKPGENYGIFFWEAWVKPYPNAQYVISDGYGGQHALLFGFDGGTDQLALSGNMSSIETNTVVSFGTNETVPANQWCHIAVGWDGQKIVTYINGFPSGIVPYTGHRSTLPSSGSGVLFVGGSDHNNFNGKIARIRGFEGKIPLENLLNSFKPEKYFRSSYMKADGEIITASFIADYSTPTNSIADLSLGFNGINHVGILGNFGDTGVFGRFNNLNGSLPVWKNDPITPPVYVPTTQTIPAGAIVYDSFSRANSDPAFGGVGLGTVEMPSANWQGTYVSDWGWKSARLEKRSDNSACLCSDNADYSGRCNCL